MLVNLHLMLALPAAADQADAWVDRRGPPSWTTLRAWAVAFAADPRNAGIMQRLRELHD